MVRTASVTVFNRGQENMAMPMGSRHLSAGGGKKGGDDDDGAGKKMKIDPQQMAFLREAMKQGRVQVVDDEPAPMSDDEKNLPQFDGEAPERVKHGMAYAAQFIQAGKVKEAVSAIEGTVQRAYREGNREDDILLEILAQAHLMAATFRQNLSQYEVGLCLPHPLSLSLSLSLSHSLSLSLSLYPLLAYSTHTLSSPTHTHASVSKDSC
jgi:hypothetical protein